jgi:DNA-binding response OmpR family regulator
MTKIAIIEDDAAIHQMYRMKFETEGFDVQLASNGKSGIELVKKFNPDIVLLDLQMPEVDGLEALRAIRSSKQNKQTPVIILTNLGEEESPKELKDLGANGYIVKADYTPRQVVLKVKETLEAAKK